MIFLKPKEWRQKAELKHKQKKTRNCYRNYQQSTKFWLIVQQEWNMIFRLRIMVHKSWIKRLNYVSRCNFVMLIINNFACTISINIRDV